MTDEKGRTDEPSQITPEDTGVPREHYLDDTPDGFEDVTTEEDRAADLRRFLPTGADPNIVPAAILSMDGDKVFARFDDFVDLATSPAGFGATCDEAILNLQESIAQTAGKPTTDAETDAADLDAGPDDHADEVEAADDVSKEDAEIPPGSYLCHVCDKILDRKTFPPEIHTEAGKPIPICPECLIRIWATAIQNDVGQKGECRECSKELTGHVGFSVVVARQASTMKDDDGDVVFIPKVMTFCEDCAIRVGGDIPSILVGKKFPKKFDITAEDRHPVGGQTLVD
jgi:hypothetical protein